MGSEIYQESSLSEKTSTMLKDPYAASNQSRHEWDQSVTC